MLLRLALGRWWLIYRRLPKSWAHPGDNTLDSQRVGGEPHVNPQPLLAKDQTCSTCRLKRALLLPPCWRIPMSFQRDWLYMPSKIRGQSLPQPRWGRLCMASQHVPHLGVP